ncbi:TolB family protein [Herbiconiux daphne]|uniref:Uncharacterized protein n=1 Tax=Herbiconiux daphne TaxID=2970914 RepID=A0ABT2H651_9MICO|nr:hypothetical protein [Herbiconiux daphne]MCS5735404.1 hypothetical protein [Herbiconiux daphne]
MTYPHLFRLASSARVLVVTGAVIAAIAATIVAPGSAAQAAAPGPSQTQLVSVTPSTPATGGNRASSDNDATGAPSISGDGRYVAFSSFASDLTATAVPVGSSQIYLRDTVAGSTRLISASAAGVAGDRQSLFPSISADGNRIAYVSFSTNITPGYTAGPPQALLFDRVSGLTTVVSVSNASPLVLGDGATQTVAISADGDVVAFESNSTNLTNDDSRGQIQAFTRTISTGVTEMVSLDTSWAGPAGAESGVLTGAGSLAISSDGGIVAFLSSSKLSSVDNRSYYEVYLHTPGSRTPEIASLDVAGLAAANDHVTYVSLRGWSIGGLLIEGHQSDS